MVEIFDGYLPSSEFCQECFQVTKPNFCEKYLVKKLCKKRRENTIIDKEIEALRREFELLKKDLQVHWENTKEERERTHTSKLYELVGKPKIEVS